MYDVERWLPESLDSVLGQSGVDLEVVVVDDGSPDGSGEIADAYAARDHRVRVVHVPNGGLGSARNIGTEHVTGDYLGLPRLRRRAARRRAVAAWRGRSTRRAPTS